MNISLITVLSRKLTHRLISEISNFIELFPSKGVIRWLSLFKPSFQFFKGYLAYNFRC
jgi:hypothetical protein